MEFMERYRRLVDERARFDFFKRLEILKRFEEGEAVPSPVPPPNDPKEAYYADYLSSCQYYQEAVVASHLGIDERPDPVADMRRVVELTREAFFGEWWQHFRHSRKYDRYPTPAHEVRSRFFEFWLTHYCYGVLCALVLDDAGSAGRLGCYPGPDVITDEAGRDLRRPDMFFHVILGSYLRYDSMEDVLDEWLRAVREGQSQRAKLWLKALRALDKGKADGFAEAFLEVAQHHRKHEYSPRLLGDLHSGPMTLLMQEGGILWHLARRKNIAPAWHDLPTEVSDHLLTVETATRKA